MNAHSPLTLVAQELLPAQPALTVAAAMSAAVDERTRTLIAEFVATAGPPPAEFAWMALGSHARGELHCASDQDHALVWATPEAAGSDYAADMARSVIDGLTAFGMQPCSGNYMADHWSLSLDDWLALIQTHIDVVTPEAIVDTDIFLDLRPIAGSLDASATTALLLLGADSPRLLHGLAQAATSFPHGLNVLGRLPHRSIDLKRNAIAPTVLIARLFGLVARSPEVSTVGRLQAAADAGVLSRKLTARMLSAYALFTELRLTHQLQQVELGVDITNDEAIHDISAPDQKRLRAALKAVRAAQSTTSMAYRTDL